MLRWQRSSITQRIKAKENELAAVNNQRRDRVAERRGRNIGVVAAARDLITLVFYGLRDHHIRCLPARTEAA
jgi:hypothetical protein